MKNIYIQDLTYGKENMWTTEERNYWNWWTTGKLNSDISSPAGKEMYPIDWRTMVYSRDVGRGDI